VVVFFNQQPTCSWLTNFRWQFFVRALKLATASHNRSAAQTCNFSQMADAASSFFVRQYACKAPFVPFVQLREHSIDRLMLFGFFAIWMQLAIFAGTLMNVSFVSLSHDTCPETLFFKTRVSYFELFKLFLDKSLGVYFANRICLFK